MTPSVIKIGLDFDEPIFPWYAYAHEACLAAGLARPEHKPTSWAPHETYECTLEEWVEVLDAEVLKGAAGMYRRPFKPGVVDAVKRAYQWGYEIHIVTARGGLGQYGEDIKRLTRQSIIHEGLPYTSLHFAKDKVPVAKELGLDYFIDDAPHNWQALHDAGINTYMHTETWNVNYPGVPLDRRVSSTKQFLQKIMDRHGRQNEVTQEQINKFIYSRH